MPKIVKDEEIFQAVVRVILERGYASATTKQIAAAAGVSEMTLFRKYENKAQLVKHAFLDIIARMDFESSTLYTGDITADLLGVVAQYQRLADRHRTIMAVLLTEVPRYPELSELLERPFSFMSETGQLIACYQAEGILRREPPLHAVSALLGPLIFTVMMRTGLTDIDLPSVDLKKHVAGFLNGRITGKKDILP